MPAKSIREIEYETVRDKLNTRENSTLVVATVASSASLVLLTALESPQFHYYGLVFALLGILYRELTIFSSDRSDHAFLRIKCSEYLPKTESQNNILKYWDKEARPIRSFVFRVLLALPIIIFFSAFAVCVLVVVIIGILVGIEECMISRRCKAIMMKLKQNLLKFRKVTKIFNR